MSFQNRQPDVAVAGGPPGVGSVFTNSNGIGGSLSSISDLKSSSQAPSGFHPPLPPKPRSDSPGISIVHANRARSESPSRALQGNAGGSEGELLRELIYTFQVR